MAQAPRIHRPPWLGLAGPERSSALIYDELRRIAAWKMSREKPGHTLQATALVNEAYLRLQVDDDGGRGWASRSHFFAAAAEAMRRILIESARRRRRLKRGGNARRVSLDSVDLPVPMPDEELLALDEALDRLAMVHRHASEVVKLCYFAGLTRPEAAREMDISLSTAERLWKFARAWLYRELRKSPTGASGPARQGPHG